MKQCELDRFRNYEMLLRILKDDILIIEEARELKEQGFKIIDIIRVKNIQDAELIARLKNCSINKVDEIYTKKLEKEINEIKNEIDKIGNEQMKMILYLKVVRQKKWREIGKTMHLSASNCLRKYIDFIKG